MRPLPLPDDYYWFECDPESYDLEFDRMKKEYKEQWDKHMAKFDKPYKLTKTELEEKITWRQGRCKRLQELNAPTELQENEKRLLDDLSTAYGKKDWLYYSPDKIYRLEYEKARGEFKFEFTPVVPEKVQEYIKEKMKEEKWQKV